MPRPGQVAAGWSSLSPQPAETIGKYSRQRLQTWGPMGHVRDLPKSTLGVDVEADQGRRISCRGTREASQGAQGERSRRVRSTWRLTPIAGEAIAWHLIQATGAASKPVHRVVFHEITLQAGVSAAIMRH